MNKSYKHEILNSIIGSDVQVRGGVYGTPQANQTVKFQYGNTIAKGANDSTPGAISFTSGANGSGAVFISGTLVSSKVLSVDWASTVNAEHGEKTITVTYISLEEGHKGEEVTKTIPVIDEAALEAYFTGSKTIEYSDSSVYEVKIKAEGGLAVDNNEGLYVDIADLFGVDASTIGFDAQNKLKTLLQLQYHAAVTTSGEEKAAYIALEDVDGNSISEIPVANIIGNGILKSVTYNKDNNTLTLVFQQADGTDRSVNVDMKDLIDINDIFLDTAHDADDYLTLTNDTSIATFGVTDKTKNAVALAESAIQGVSEGTSVENYVTLTVANGSDPSTKTIAIDDSELNTKITEIDSSIDALQAKDEEIDSSIERLNSSVNTLENAIAALDATESDNVLDGSIAITVTQADGLVTGVNLEATKSTVVYTAKAGDTPASLTATEGLLTGGDIAAVVNYVNSVAEAGFDSLDSSIDVSSTDASLNFKVVETDGKIVSGEISYVKSTVTYTAEDGATPSNISATEGFLTGGDVAILKQYIDSVSGRFDSIITESDVSTYVTVTTGIVDGELLDSSSSVSVTYADITASAGTVTVTTDGVATGYDVKKSVEGALTWTILS